MKCPGQDSKYWKDDAIFEVDCPKCGTPVEFYKDDTSRKCSSCKHRFVNPKMDFGCASYCQFAEQCLGTLPEDFTGPKDDLIKDKVAVEVKRFFHTDFKAIRQAATAARYAEEIGKVTGGNLALVLCTTYLHGIGDAEMEAILKKVGANAVMFDEIRKLATDLKSPLTTASKLEIQIIHDALLLSSVQDRIKSNDIEANELEPILDQKLLLTDSIKLAKEQFGLAVLS